MQVKKKTGPPATSLATAAEAKKFVDGSQDEVVVVGIFPGDSLRKQKKTFEKVPRCSSSARLARHGRLCGAGGAGTVRAKPAVRNAVTLRRSRGRAHWLRLVLGGAGGNGNGRNVQVWHD